MNLTRVIRRLVGAKTLADVLTIAQLADIHEATKELLHAADNVADALLCIGTCNDIKRQVSNRLRYWTLDDDERHIGEHLIGRAA